MGDEGGKSWVLGQGVGFRACRGYGPSAADGQGEALRQGRQTPQLSIHLVGSTR